MVFVLDIRSYRLITYQNQVIVIGYIVTYGLIGDLVEIKLLPTRFRMFLPIFGNILTFPFVLDLLRLHFWENKVFRQCSRMPATTLFLTGIT